MENIEEKVNYCLQCKIKPCSNKGCPLHNDIPAFIEKVKEENYKEAYKILCRTTVLPGVCGRICPHEKQCQSSCVRGIKGEPVSIGELEAYVFDKAMEAGESLRKVWKLEEKTCLNESEFSEQEINEDETDTKNKIQYLNKKKVAVIGGGPAGLTASAFLAKERNQSYNI